MSDDTEWPPRIPIAGLCVIRDGSGNVLMLRPTYRPGWSLPGGAVDPGESPLAGSLRELHEETGISRAQAQLVCVDYRHADEEGIGWVRFVFDAGCLDAAEEKRIVIQQAEIAEWRLMPVEEAVASFEDPSSGRLLAVSLASSGGPPVYTEDGVPVD